MKQKNIWVLRGSICFSYLHIIVCGFQDFNCKILLPYVEKYNIRYYFWPLKMRECSVF